MVPCPWPGGNTWWHDGEREVKALFPHLLLSKRKYGRAGGTSWPNRAKGLEETLQIPCSTFPFSSLSSGLSHFNGEMPQLRLTSTLGITLLSIEAGEQHQPVLLGTSSLPLCSVHEQSTSNVDWWEQISSWSLFAPLLILPTSGAAPTPTKYPLTPSKHNILLQKRKKKKSNKHNTVFPITEVLPSFEHPQKGFWFPAHALNLVTWRVSDGYFLQPLLVSCRFFSEVLQLQVKT